MRRSFLNAAIVFYAAFALVALIWAYLAGRPSVFWIGERPSVESVLAWSGVGLLFGLIVVLASDLAEARFQAVRSLSDAFREVLGPLGWPQAILLGLVSSLGEEMLFRGAMIPTLGLGVSTLIFALLHWPMDARLRIWPVFAGAVGLAFGWAFQESGHLAAPLVAHFVINAINLRAIGSR